MVKSFGTYSTASFCPCPVFAFCIYPSDAELSFLTPKIWHCEHTRKCASANACCAKRPRQKKAAEQHEAQARAAEQHSTPGGGVAGGPPSPYSHPWCWVPEDPNAPCNYHCQATPDFRSKTRAAQRWGWTRKRQGFVVAVGVSAPTDHCIDLSGKGVPEMASTSAHATRR